MSWVAAAVAGSAVVGYIGSQNAANTEAGAANNANNVAAQSLAIQQANEAPYQQAGVSALSQMQNPSFQQGFTTADFQQSPGYQFALDQGNNALKASQAAQGNNISGAGLTALDQYNQGMANQQYQQAFQNYNTTQNQNFSRLSTIAGMGAGANAGANSASQNYSNAYGANTQAGAGATAGGMMSGTNFLGQGLQGVTNSLNTAAPSNSGYQTMGQFAAAPGSNLQAPTGYLGGGLG